MDKVTGKELQKQAKDLGLNGFWKLRKAELFNLIRSRLRQVINFINGPPQRSSVPRERSLDLPPRNRFLLREQGPFRLPY